MRLPILSGISSGVIDLTGYSVAGADSNVLVVGFGVKIVGSFSPFSTASSGRTTTPFVFAV